MTASSDLQPLTSSASSLFRILTREGRGNRTSHSVATRKAEEGLVELLLCASSVFSVSPWLYCRKLTTKAQRTRRLHREISNYFLLKVRLSTCLPFGPSMVMSILRFLPSGESVHLRVVWM